MAGGGMKAWQLLALGVAALLMFWMLGAHNRLMALRVAIQTAWTQMEAVLAQRSGTIARLIQTLRPHLANEHATLDALLVASTHVDDATNDMRPRPYAAAPAKRLVDAEANLAGSLARTLALVEQRPEWGAHPDIRPLVQALRQAEPQAVFGRQLFNQAASAYGAAVRQWPTRWVARVLGFKPAGRL
jgi:LemA protein